jgi:hypothetical protein
VFPASEAFGRPAGNAFTHKTVIFDLSLPHVMQEDGKM